jgi:hypothetical protein
MIEAFLGDDSITLGFLPHAGAWFSMCYPTYRPRPIKTPAAIARKAMIIPRPEKLRFRSGMSPVAMSQMPNKSMPRFLVSFMRAPFRVSVNED